MQEMTSKKDDKADLAKLLSRGWVSLNQFAKIIGVAYPTAQRMVKRGEVNVTPVGGVNRIYTDEVKRFLKEGNAAKGTGEGASSSQPDLDIDMNIKE